MKKQKHQGFTLIELVIYMGLLGILLAVMSDVFIGILHIKLESESNSQVVLDGNFIGTRLAHDIHRASRIIAPNIGQTSSGLSLGIMENGAEQVYQYTVIDNTLSLVEGENTDILNGTDTHVSQFLVTRIGNSETLATAKDTISIAYTVSSVNVLSSGTDELPFQLTVGLR